MSNNKKKLWALLGVLVVIVIIIIVAMSQGTKKTANQGTNTPPGNNGTATSQNGAAQEAVQKPNANPVFEVGNGVITPKSFMVEYPSDTSLTIVSSDNQSHDIVSDDPAVGIGHIIVGPGESKTVIFKTPKPGQYSLSCSVAGHKAKGEVAELIVSEKPTKTNPIAVFNKSADEQKIPGASLLVSGGVITPNKFTVAAGLPVSFGITSGDGQAHNIVFSDKGLKDDVLQVGANETKSIVFTAPKAGEYDFHCNIPGHEKEAGKMIVK